MAGIRSGVTANRDVIRHVCQHEPGGLSFMHELSIAFGIAGVGL